MARSRIRIDEQSLREFVRIFSAALAGDQPLDRPLVTSGLNPLRTGAVTTGESEAIQKGRPRIED